MTFWINQKVVCAVAPMSPIAFPYRSYPERDHVYTVRGFRNDRSLWLNEIVNDTRDGMECGFLTTRFRPIVERKTSISIFTQMLAPSRRKETV